MSKNKRGAVRQLSRTGPVATATPLLTQSDGSVVEAFTFGDPEPVSRIQLLDYVESMFNGRWYEPPLPWEGLASAFRASPHHGSAIYLKRNLLKSMFVPHPRLSSATFGAWALDFLVFGNGYLEQPRSMTMRALELRHSLSKYTRRGEEAGSYFFVRGWQQEHEFPQGSVFHLREDDINQEIYGLPEYISALQSAWLNEAATMFRRKYYANGSHAGFILYLTDGQVDNSDADALRLALKNAKGPGNFRNLFLHMPGGKSDGLKLIPVSEVAAKDDFAAIKNVSKDDVLAAHRVPPGLLGIVPTNAGGFGNAPDALRVFVDNEIRPLMQRFRELNEWAGEELVRFIVPPGLDSAPAG
ncbi:phage portal protein [Variovorax ureilyticus]|uniref:phage portal protein n=1 Tax=Variovorax ureilyticus TaxID=1836198 RepID=UPI003D678DF0